MRLVKTAALIKIYRHVYIAVAHRRLGLDGDYIGQVEKKPHFLAYIVVKPRLVR